MWKQWFLNSNTTEQKQWINTISWLLGDHFFKSELVWEVELGGIEQIIKKTFVELNENQRVSNLFSEGMIENTVEENLEEYFDQEVQ